MEEMEIMNTFKHILSCILCSNTGKTNKKYLTFFAYHIENSQLYYKYAKKIKWFVLNLRNVFKAFEEKCLTYHSFLLLKCLQRFESTLCNPSLAKDFPFCITSEEFQPLSVLINTDSTSVQNLGT